jgi:hypothetical protein
MKSPSKTRCSEKDPVPVDGDQGIQKIRIGRTNSRKIASVVPTAAILKAMMAIKIQAIVTRLFRDFGVHQIMMAEHHPGKKSSQDQGRGHEIHRQ